MRVAFRLYIDGKLDFEETLDIEPHQLQEVSDRHMLRVFGKDVWLVEVELLDDMTDPERFMRFGTDTSLMVAPMDDPDKHPWSGQT